MTIPGFSAYEITENGEISRVDSSHILKPYLSPGGYRTIKLTDDNHKRRTCLVHRLVVQAHQGEIPKGMWVNHKDGDKCNNHISNLEVVSPSESYAHARDVLKREYAKGESCAKAKLTQDEAEMIRHLLSAGFSQGKIARAFLVSQASISYLANNKTWC